MSARPRIVLIRANNIKSDTRTIKMFAAVSKFAPCQLILWNRDQMAETEPKAIRYYAKAPLGSSLFYFYLPFWTIFCLRQLWQIRPGIIHGCDSEGFVPAYLYRLIFPQTKIIFDIHDVAAGKYNGPAARVVRALMLALDRFFIKRANTIFVPDPQRIDQLGFTKTSFAPYQKKCVVTYNSTIITKGRKQVSFHAGQSLTASYIGNLTRDIRGVEFILEAIPKCPHIFFHIAGMGADAEYFQKAFSARRSPNFKFYGRITHDEAMKLNSDCDVMISLLNPNYPNYKYASSTKLFEAFNLFKPIIVSKHTATSAILDVAKWGIAIDYKSGELEKVLADITSGAIKFDLDSGRVEQFSWDEMEKRIHNTYEKLVVGSE